MTRPFMVWFFSQTSSPFGQQGYQQLPGLHTCQVQIQWKRMSNFIPTFSAKFFSFTLTTFLDYMLPLPEVNLCCWRAGTIYFCLTWITCHAQCQGIGVNPTGSTWNERGEGQIPKWIPEEVPGNRMNKCWELKKNNCPFHVHFDSPRQWVENARFPNHRYQWNSSTLPRNFAKYNLGNPNSATTGLFGEILQMMEKLRQRDEMTCLRSHGCLFFQIKGSHLHCGL